MLRPHGSTRCSMRTGGGGCNPHTVLTAPIACGSVGPSSGAPRGTHRACAHRQPLPLEGPTTFPAATPVAGGLGRRRRCGFYHLLPSWDVAFGTRPRGAMALATPPAGSASSSAPMPTSAAGVAAAAAAVTGGAGVGSQGSPQRVLLDSAGEGGAFPTEEPSLRKEAKLTQAQYNQIYDRLVAIFQVAAQRRLYS
jgi:hypothetical protein